MNRLEEMTELSDEETAELFKTLDAEVGPEPGPVPAAHVQEFDPVHERSPARAVESLRRYTADCRWVKSVDWAGERIGIEIEIEDHVSSHLKLRLPNFVNGYRVNAWDEESHPNYIKIGEDLDPRRKT